MARKVNSSTFVEISNQAIYDKVLGVDIKLEALSKTFSPSPETFSSCWTSPIVVKWSLVAKTVLHIPRLFLCFGFLPRCFGSWIEALTKFLQVFWACFSFSHEWYLLMTWPSSSSSRFRVEIYANALRSSPAKSPFFIAFKIQCIKQVHWKRCLRQALFTYCKETNEHFTDSRTSFSVFFWSLLEVRSE